MFSKDELVFYSRHILLEDMGEQVQLALKKTRVLVIGAGGLGCPALMHLAGAGIGTLGVVDADTVHLSNLHRQNLYGHSQIGSLKANAAIERLSDINPYIEYKAFPTKLEAGNALEVINNFDIIVDATDNFTARYLINDACVILDKPFVFASIDQFQGQICVFNYESEKGIKGPTYRCLFPNPPSPEAAPNCAEIGVVGVLPGTIGCLQANEVIKMAGGPGEVLSGKLLLIDLLQNRFMHILVNRDDNPRQNIFDLKKGISDSIYYDFCNGHPFHTVKNITQNEIQSTSLRDFQMIDVRESFNSDTITDSQRIPSSKLKENIDTLNKNKKIVVFCDYGITSQKAAAELQKLGLNVYNLQGGLQQWNRNEQ